jgi:hypothetical protein
MTIQSLLLLSLAFMFGMCALGAPEPADKPAAADKPGPTNKPAQADKPAAELTRDAHRFLKYGKQRADAPVRWVPPASLDLMKFGLGLPKLEGTEDKVLLDPKPSRANTDEGGKGKYESPAHGVYNHGVEILLLGDKIILYWVNAGLNEGDRGTRVVGRVGTFNPERTAIDWGGAETFFELLPPMAPVGRRPTRHDAKVINELEPSVVSFCVIGDRLYLFGSAMATHGYTDDLQYRMPMPGSEPIPPEHWSDEKKKNFDKFDVFWHPGFNYVQRWRADGKTIVPDTSIYRTSAELPARLEVNPGRFKELLPPGEPYAGAKPYAEAPEDFKNDVKNGKRKTFARFPKYASAEAMRAAADGKNGLCHHTEFRRPDGKWVAVRDNLLDPEGFADACYYAALKDKDEDNYPPGRKTNLSGASQPIAGELPDGRPWFIGRTAKRGGEIYISVSKDGAVFDRSWSLISRDLDADEKKYGGIPGGPSYFKQVTVGDNIWLFYSIKKRLICLTRIPISKLMAQADAMPAAEEKGN